MLLHTFALEPDHLFRCEVFGLVVNLVKGVFDICGRNFDDHVGHALAHSGKYSKHVLPGLLVSNRLLLLEGIRPVARIPFPKLSCQPLLVIAGLLVKYANVTLNDTITQALGVLVLAIVTGVVTYLVPNKVQQQS
jgi:hypothetical protein